LKAVTNFKVERILGQGNDDKSIEFFADVDLIILPSKSKLAGVTNKAAKYSDTK
jgi:hypothetical protein